MATAVPIAPTTENVEALAVAPPVSETAAAETQSKPAETSAEAGELKTEGTDAQEVKNAAIAAPAPAPVETTPAEPVEAPVEETKPVEAEEVKPAEAPAEETKPAEASAPTKEVEEPQNALTGKFTDAEWAALKEFRPMLPDVLATARPEDPAAKSTAVTIWGVPLDPAQVAAPTDARLSVVLMKFLRARNLNPTEAKSMLVATLRWRDEFKVDEVMHEKFDEDVYGNVGHIYGKDKLGHPITYNLYGANKDAFKDVPTFIRWRVQFMERGVQLLDFENVDQMIQVHDYDGVSMSSRDANTKNAASEATSIFSSHYPEFLAPNGKFFVNVPTVMAWMFWLFKPVLSAATLAKMRVVGSGPKAIGKEMLPFVEPKELPKRYGGEAEAF